MAYVSKMDLRIKLAKLSSATLYGLYILMLGFVLFSLGACSTQYETMKKVTTITVKNPVKKIDSIKGGVKFQSPLRINSLHKCN